MPPLARILLLAAATLGLQALVLSRAFHTGPLAGLVPWDDCLIALRQLYNLRVLGGAASVMDLFGRMAAVIVHSPVSDLPVMVGLLLAGGKVWGAYALNGLVVLAGLQVALVRTGRTPAPLFVALAATALLQPMTLAALTFLKADWKGGVLAAAAIFTLYLAARRGDRRLTLWGAGLMGAAVAAKLTAFYGPVFAVATLAAFEAVAFAARRAEGPLTLEAYLADARPTLAPALALALGPYVAFYLWGVLGAHGLVGYIVFALGEAWNDGLSLPQRAAAYAPFSSNPAWAALSWQLLVFGGAALALAWTRRDRVFLLAFALLAGLALMQLAPLAVARTSNPEFGAMLVGVALGAMLISVREVGLALPRYGAAAALALSLALAALGPRSVPLFAPAAGPTVGELRALESTYRRIVAEIAARSPAAAPKTLVLYEHLFAPFPNLSMLYRERTGELMDVDRVDDLGPSGVERLSGADFVLALQPSGGAVRGLEPRFETSRDPAAADRMVAAQAGFARVAAFPIEGGELRLYQRAAKLSRPATSTPNNGKN